MYNLGRDLKFDYYTKGYDREFWYNNYSPATDKNCTKICGRVSRKNNEKQVEAILHRLKTSLAVAVVF